MAYIPIGLLLSGIMDSQTKCWKEGMFGWPSSRNTLHSRQELPRGDIAKSIFIVLRDVVIAVSVLLV